MPRPGMTRVRVRPLLSLPAAVIPSASIRTVSSETGTMPLFCCSYCSAVTIRGASSMPDSVCRGMVPRRTHSSRVPVMTRRTLPR